MCLSQQPVAIIFTRTHLYVEMSQACAVCAKGLDFWCRLTVGLDQWRPWSCDPIKDGNCTGAYVWTPPGVPAFPFHPLPAGCDLEKLVQLKSDMPTASCLLKTCRISSTRALNILCRETSIHQHDVLGRICKAGEVRVGTDFKPVDNN